MGEGREDPKAGSHLGGSRAQQAPEGGCDRGFGGAAQPASLSFLGEVKQLGRPMSEKDVFTLLKRKWRHPFGVTEPEWESSGCRLFF